jgi:hypothetical protein
MIAACVLLALNVVDSPGQAIAEVRARRGPEAVQTSRQRDYVSSFHKQQLLVT